MDAGDDGDPADELEPLPPDKSYHSADEADGPSTVLEGDDLIGVPDRAEEVVAGRQAPSDGDGVQNVEIGAGSRSKDPAAAKMAADQKKWTPLKTDGTGTERFQRPEFEPYKTPPEGFVAGPEHDEGGPRPELLAKLTPDTHPAVFVAEMGFNCMLFEQMKNASNEYAVTKGAGTEEYWKEFRPFTTKEIMSGCGLLLRNGVAPVPSMSLNFKDPGDSFVWGDDRVKQVWKGEQCGGSDRRWKQFRSFLHIQSPNPFEFKQAKLVQGEHHASLAGGEVIQFVRLPFETIGPLYKVEPMLSNARLHWERGRRPGKNLSLDEETQHSEARSSNKQRIKHKAEGDGYQCDAIADRGYTYTFWFRCDKLPVAAEKGVSDRDTRCLWLASRLPGRWYRLWMDNLFVSFGFGQMLAEKYEILFGGTCTTQEYRGLHKAVIQVQKTKVKEIEEARGTVKASVRSEGMPAGCEVLSVSYYDAAPFNMMSNIPDASEWTVEIHRKCFNVGTQKHFWVTIGRLHLADAYNFYMNSVDLSDQYRVWYRPDTHWTRMRKWWWALFVWCMGQTVVNAYLTYMDVCNAARKKPMSHLDFRVAVVTAWCKEPDVVLKYPEPTAPSEPEQGGVRGERQRAAAAAREAREAEEAGGSGARAAAPGAAPAAEATPAARRVRGR